MEIKELVKTAHGMAKAKGWHEGTPRTALELHMLVVSEIAEASEEVRNRSGAFYLRGSAGRTPDVDPTEQGVLVSLQANPGGKPEGEATELADAIIRIADIFGARGWDLEAVLKAKMAYNATRPHRHGGKAL